MIAVILLSVLSSCKKTKDGPVFPREVTPIDTSPGDQDEAPVSPDEPTITPTPPPQDSPPLSAIAQEVLGLLNKIDGSTATIPLTAAIFEEIGSAGAAPVHNTTSEAYYYLINNYNTDLIFVTYPSEDEFQMAKQEGVELEIIPIVKDALVFLVNVGNKVGNITRRQLQDVYLGSITNWNSLGGLNENIIPYQRTKNSGSQTLLLKLVMDGREPMLPPTEWVAESMGSLVEVVSGYDNSREAIGYSMFYFVNNMYGNSQFKLLSVDGVKPTRDTIMRGEYPLEDCYYAVLRKDTPQGHPARKLVDWILSDEGQKLAAKAGYIPLRPMEGIWPDDAIDPIYLGETEKSSGTGGTTLINLISEIEPVNGVRPPLSDLFFDGFNYIEFINAEIIKYIERTHVEDWTPIRYDEEYLIRPFTGIPNDYPNYLIYGSGYLYIEFPEGNPFFSQPTRIFIPLSDKISPYGIAEFRFSVTYQYARRLIPRVDLLTMQVDLADRPEVSSKINKSLDVWSDSFPGSEESVKLLNDFVKWYIDVICDGYVADSWTYKLQPSAVIWKDYLSVSYILELFDGPSTHMPMAYTISFDINTGNVVYLDQMLPSYLDYYNAIVFVPFGRSPGDPGSWGFPGEETMPDGYAPPAGSIITDAWVSSGTLNIYLTEPNGRVLQACFWDMF